jgi:hypothetical protein
MDAQTFTGLLPMHGAMLATWLFFIFVQVSIAIFLSCSKPKLLPAKMNGQSTS